MLVSVDIGNTTIHLSLIQDGMAVGSFRLPTGEDYTRQSLLDKLTPLIPRDAEGSVLSSVVPPLTGLFSQCLELLLGKEPLVISHKLDLGIRLGVDFPEKVGPDRLVDAAWAAEKYGVPVITADLGTATTINVVDENRVFRGGIICAGVTTGIRALDKDCAALDSTPLGQSPVLIGTNTAQAMESGALLGTAALLEGLVRRIRQQLGREVPLVVTGGHSRLVCPHLLLEHIRDPYLLPQGLAYLYRRNS